MRRRDKTGGKAAKRQRRQTLRRRNTAKVARRRKPYAADANEKIALTNATRLCEGNLAALWRYDGKFLFGAAQYNATTEFVDMYMGTKMQPGRAGPARL